MNKTTLLLRDGSVYLDGTLQDVDLLLKDGIIEKIIKRGETIPSEVESISVAGLAVFPGFIDSHVHFREPGLTYKEDFGTGSQAAVMGGVTTVLDMPNTKPPVFTLQDLETKRALARAKSIVNYGLYFGTDGNNADAITSAKNIPGVKVYMNITTGNLLLEDTDPLQAIFNLPQKFSLHAEGDTFKKALSMLVPTGNQIYLCHASLAYEVQMVRELKKTGYPVYMEACPHHLFMTEKDRAEKGAYCCMKPELATQVDQDALWEGLLDGTIDTIATDHAPHTHADKDAENPAFGVPGVQEMVSLLFTAVHDGKISLQRLVTCIAENPAKIFGMQGKGHIKEGYDADLTVMDMQERSTLLSSKAKSRCQWSAYDQWKVIGVPKMTIVGGQIAMRDGEVFPEVRGKEVIFS
jgi:dihydroorotase